MASPKEVHLFDSPKYSDDWTPEQIDERYRSFFDHCGDVSIRGEATPIYMFLPEIARELARYNPELKLLVLLHDPVERALSHYYMEKNRGKEHRPLWLALAKEPFRLRRCKGARAYGSEMRVFSYRRRGLYSLQLRNLYRFFRPGPDTGRARSGSASKPSCRPPSGVRLSRCVRARADRPRNRLRGRPERQEASRRVVAAQAVLSGGVRADAYAASRSGVTSAGRGLRVSVGPVIRCECLENVAGPTPTTTISWSTSSTHRCNGGRSDRMVRGASRCILYVATMIDSLDTGGPFASPGRYQRMVPRSIRMCSGEPSSACSRRSPSRLMLNAGPTFQRPPSR